MTGGDSMKTLILVAGFLLFFTGCASKQVSSPVLPVLPEEKDKSVTTRASWQEEWEKTLALAKKERRISIFTTVRPLGRDAWMKNFGDRFGIDMEFVTGRGAEIRERLLSERRAGIISADLVITGLTTMHLVLEPAGVFESFENQLFIPEVLDTRAWFEGRLPWFTEKRFIWLWRMYPTQNTWVNTQRIKPGEISSYRDLLQPQWKGGKFVLNDPTTSGPGSKWFEVYVREEFLGVDYMKAFVKQEPVVTRDERLATSWVAQGKYPMSVGFDQSGYEVFLLAGASVAALELKEPPYLTSGSGNLAWIKGNPHPAATKLFVNWLLSREGGEISQKAEKIQSAREDIGTEGLGVYRKKGVKYFNANIEEMYIELNTLRLKELAKEIFGPLVK